MMSLCGVRWGGRSEPGVDDLGPNGSIQHFFVEILLTQINRVPDFLQSDPVSCHEMRRGESRRGWTTHSERVAGHGVDRAGRRERIRNEVAGHGAGVVAGQCHAQLREKLIDGQVGSPPEGGVHCRVVRAARIRACSSGSPCALESQGRAP